MANLGADALRTRGRQQRARRSGEAYPHPAGVEAPSHARKHRVRDSGGSASGLAHRSKARTGNRKDTTVTHGRRESDSSIVLEKRPNKGTHEL